MRCFNCQFENMPGITVCGRCNSRLDLEKVEFEPPRASSIRAITHFQTCWYKVKQAFSGLRNIRIPRFIRRPEPISGKGLAWSIIPGLGHLKTQRRRTGKILLGLWLVFLLLMFLSIGTTWTTFWIMCMIAVHTYAIMTFFRS